MDQRVSPVATRWVAGNCPSGAGAGAAWDVSCAGSEVSGRACVVSCAASAGASPASSPATRAKSRAARSERQIVVLLIQGLRERVERFRLAPSLGRYLGGRFGPREIAGPLAAFPRRQEDHCPRDGLGGVPGLLHAIFPGPVLDAPLDVDPVPLLHVLLRQIRQLGAFVVPADHPMPFGLFLLLSTLPRPLPTGRQGQRGDAGAIGGAPHLRIGPQVPD